MKRLFFCLVCVCAVSANAPAHVLDQYLQAAKIALEPGGLRLELRLTPGVQVADRVMALIDLDRDGQISAAEEQAYAHEVLREITLDLDGRRLTLALTGVHFPSRREMSEGVGSIRLELLAAAALDSPGDHQLSFRNDHQPEVGAYLANALVPETESIEITGLQRDELQHGLRVSFRVRSAHRTTPLWTGVFLFGACLTLAIPSLFRVWRAT
jgi:hypothetical protein